MSLEIVAFMNITYIGVRDMLGLIIKFPLAVFSEEWRRVLAFKINPKKNLEPLIEYLENRAPNLHRVVGLYYSSRWSTIRICDDIYGYEVKILGGELVDCCPHYYGLDYEEGKRLYRAILGLMPGSVRYTKKNGLK